MSDQILDKSNLLEEVNGDKDLLSRWFEIFDRDCNDRLPKLREAIKSGDCETLMNEAHAIKGGLGVLFAKASYETAYKLEMMGRNEDPSAAEATFQTFESDLQSLKQALGELIRS